MYVGKWKQWKTLHILVAWWAQIEDVMLMWQPDKMWVDEVQRMQQVTVSKGASIKLKRAVHKSDKKYYMG